MKRRPSSGIWRDSSWGILLASARRLLDGVGCRDWAFGGGSAIAHRIAHRISYDADIFMRDPQYLNYLTPRLNDMAATIAGSYDESSNSLKLTTSLGDIDFVVCRNVLGDDVDLETIGGASVPTHRNSEILAKKIEYRGFKFTFRDMFDLAVLCDIEPDSVQQALAGCSQASIDLAMDRIREEIGSLGETLPEFVNPTPFGAPYVGRTAGILATYFEEELALAEERSRSRSVS